MTLVLLLGDAKCVHDDAEAALKLFTPEVVAATNNVAISWPGHIDHWFTLHPLPCNNWVGIEQAVKRRVQAGLNKPFTWAHKAGRGIDYDTPDWAGSTGLLAVKGLIEIGCTNIVLAGVPMTREAGHYYNKEDWLQADRYHKGWTKHLDRISPYVRSMSGWTRELLGYPTETWLGTTLEPSKTKGKANGQTEISR